MDDEAKQRRAESIRNYQLAFEGDPGKAVLNDLMEYCYLLRPLTPPPESRNPEREAAIREGRREVILKILEMVSYDTVDLLNMLGEETQTKKQGGDSNEKDEDLYDFFNE